MRLGLDPARFDAVEAHPDAVAAPDQPVLPTDAVIGIAARTGPLVVSLFGGLFVLVALTLVFVIRPPLAFSLLFVGIAVVFVLGGLAVTRRLAAVRDSPIERLTAVVVKERLEISGRTDATTTTSYFVTLQTRDGTRTEYRLARALIGKLVVDDIGIAYVKEVVLELGFATYRARSLVEFIRVDVDN